ncbi:MAG: mechanosensitive ion channel [Gammaproteobacteria bacterium]|nr:mechanosensitive ion channel [Gammaproteobacteria bacterium]MCP4474122.1 mechanosensitive ion channel [Gammaproteobacteria bacterium]
MTTTNTTSYHLLTLFYHHGLNLLAAIIIIAVGFALAKLTRQLANRVMMRREVETTIRLFINQLLYTLILISVFLAALAKVGISIASLVAILGAAALAISLSLKDSLSNLASGFLLLLFRPFRVDDELTFSNHCGVVKRINLLFTTIEDDNQQKTIIPNSKLTANLMQNIPHTSLRELHCRIKTHREDAATVQQQLLPLLSSIESVHNRDSLEIVIATLAADSITFCINLNVTYNRQREVKQQILQKLYQHYKTTAIEVVIQ